MTAYKVSINPHELTEKIPSGSPFWPTFNSSFKNVEYEPVDIASAIYSGCSITTQHINHWRDTKNYLCGQHLGLDFDTGDTNSTIDYLMRDKFVSRYGSILYTTMSHTDAAPRARVLFLLDTPIMQPKNYILAATSLLWLFGTADRQCKDAVRFFYGSPNCRMELPGKVLPLDMVKHLITQYQESGQAEKKRVINPNFHAPASQTEVQAALDKINPWGIDYGEWVQVLMGIHSEFGEGGLPLAEYWAKGEPGEVERKWKSFNASGNTEGAVTIGTVFGIAKRFGWSRNNG